MLLSSVVSVGKDTNAMLTLVYLDTMPLQCSLYLLSVSSGNDT
jgi:hypothetical protein